MHHRYVDANQVTTLRALLAPTGWLERTRAFALGLRKATRSPGGFLLVGTPEEEPWHLTAHLDEDTIRVFLGTDLITTVPRVTRKEVVVRKSGEHNRRKIV